jgi:dihydropyrimidinase
MRNNEKKEFMVDLLIKNGLIIQGGNEILQDILIRDEKIYAVDNNIVTDQPVEIIQADGRMIFPGGVDPHVHMELPTPAGNSSDDFYSGSKAAIAGGTTTFIDFVTPGKGESLISAFLKRKKLAEKSITDYSFHVSPTWWGNESANEMEILVKEHGIRSFKCYMAYQETVGITDSELMKVMRTAKKLDALVTLHCEDNGIIQQNIQKYLGQGNVSPKYHALSRPPAAEALAVKKAIDFAAVTGCRIYIVHVSTSGAVDLIRKARSSGLEVYGETCPQYLLLDDSVYDQPFEKSAPFVISPPLRKKEDRQALWEALADGTLQTVGTDHCPFNLKGQKDLGKEDFTKIPNGAGGVEHRLSLLYTYGVLTKKISLKKFQEITSENPASVFGLKTKDSPKHGIDADLVIWSSDKESEISTATHHQNCDSNIYEGLKITGIPGIVIAGGEIVFMDNRFNERGRKGKFLGDQN